MENPFLAAASSIVLPRDTFWEVGGFPEERRVQGSEDWIFLARLVGASHAISVVPEPLVNYRVHELNSTANLDSVARSMWAAIELVTAALHLDSRAEAKLTATTAGVIARQMARESRLKDSLSWLGRATAAGAGPRISLLVLARTIASAGKGLTVSMTARKPT